MHKTKTACLLLLIALLSGLPLPAPAKQFKSSDFLRHSEEQRTWWYIGAFESIGHVASLKNKDQGNCIWTWYFSDGDAKNILIERAMKKYPDYTPTAIVIALLQQACGPLNP